MISFCHLNLFSEFSTGYSNTKISDLIDFYKFHNIYTVVFTDYNNLSESLRFSNVSCDDNIFPILGAIITVSCCDFIGNILIIIENSYGYFNLLKLISLSTSDIDNILDLYFVFKYSQGLIIIFPMLESLIDNMYRNHYIYESEIIISLFKVYFESNFYLEINRIFYDYVNTLEYFYKYCSLKYNIIIIGSNPIKFINMIHYYIFSVYFVDKESNYIDNNINCFYKNLIYFDYLFSDSYDYIDNSLFLIKKCTFLLNYNYLLLPCLYNNYSKSESILIKVSILGMLSRFDFSSILKYQLLYLYKLNRELKIIINTKFTDYFLIVYDFLQWSRYHNISMGLGRGSGSGSLVTWSLFITHIDPSCLGLYFERFLNPKRITVPDLDIDFCKKGRDSIINYFKLRFGKNKHSHIAAFGKLHSKAAFRDFGKLTDIPFNKLNFICQSLPHDLVNVIDVKRIFFNSHIFRHNFYDRRFFKNLLNIAINFEGINKNISIHAAGVSLSGLNTMRKIALSKDINSNTYMAQYSQLSSEYTGLIKFDFLGLKILTVISVASILVKSFNISFDSISVPANDSLTYGMFGHGHVVGIFQFEGIGIKEALIRLLPDNLNDLVALVSLYRPGPMENIKFYIYRKHGFQNIFYSNYLSRDVLTETYGIVIYQEQVMRATQLLAGYSISDADILRRLMSKKEIIDMTDQAYLFLLQCMNIGFNEHQSEEIFSLLHKFSNYGFNKSHAASYSYLSYRIAYLKSHYPLHYFIVSINLDIYNHDKINIFLLESRKHYIRLLLPDINYSRPYFSVESNCIRFGLMGVKTLGIESSNIIFSEREYYGLYFNIYDFIIRIFNYGLSKKNLENLATAGSFDNIFVNRQMFFKNIFLLFKFADKLYTVLFYGFNNYFKYIEYKTNLLYYHDWNILERINLEFSSIGYYVSYHPTTAYKFLFLQLILFDSDVSFDSYNNCFKINVIAVISKRIYKNTNKKYCFLKISDAFSSIDTFIYDLYLLINFMKYLYIGNILLFSLFIRVGIFTKNITIYDIRFIYYHLNNSTLYFLIVIKNFYQLIYIRNIYFKKIIKNNIKSNIIIKNKFNQAVFFNNIIYLNLIDLLLLQKYKLLFFFNFTDNGI